MTKQHQLLCTQSNEGKLTVGKSACSVSVYLASSAGSSRNRGTLTIFRLHRHVKISVLPTALSFDFLEAGPKQLKVNKGLLHHSKTKLTTIIIIIIIIIKIITSV
jgi:hypothetical protein